jgi:dethiobiotin synthetase
MGAEDTPLAAWVEWRRVRGIFVTATDTGVGKTVLAAAICATLAEQGRKVAAFKPVVTGTDEEPDEWPRDHELLAQVATIRQKPSDVAPLSFGPAVSPHLAAELAGDTIEPHELAAAARSAAENADVLVAEGVGGILVPLTPGYLVRDQAVELDLPIVIAARTGLGTINHTLLTIEAARAVGLDVAAVVMTPWPDEPDEMVRSNKATIERFGNVNVVGLPETSQDDLATAGKQLPIDEWMGTSGPDL